MCRMRYEPMPSKMPERIREPVPVHECVKCGYGILVGDKFWDSPEGKICEECVNDMSAEEILKLCGESLTEAEKEER